MVKIAKKCNSLFLFSILYILLRHPGIRLIKYPKPVQCIRTPTTTEPAALRRGRKPIVIEPVETLPAVEPALEAAIAEIRDGTVSVQEQDYAKHLFLAEEMGKTKMAETMRAGLELRLVQWFAAIKEGGEYKSAPIARPDKTVFFPKTFTELCEGMGFSYQKIYDDLQNLRRTWTPRTS